MKRTLIITCGLICLLIFGLGLFGLPTLHSPVVKPVAVNEPPPTAVYETKPIVFDETKYDWKKIAEFGDHKKVTDFDKAWVSYVPGVGENGKLVHDDTVVYYLDSLTGEYGYTHKYDPETKKYSIYIATDIHPLFNTRNGPVTVPEPVPEPTSIVNWFPWYWM